MCCTEKEYSHVGCQYSCDSAGNLIMPQLTNDKGGIYIQAMVLLVGKGKGRPRMSLKVRRHVKARLPRGKDGPSVWPIAQALTQAKTQKTLFKKPLRSFLSPRVIAAAALKHGLMMMR